MFKHPRFTIDSNNIKYVGRFVSDEQRDSYMTNNSDYDICYIRCGKENSGTTKTLKRRLLNK